MRVYLLFLTLFFCSISFAQNSISGTVSDSKKQPIPGANIIIVGTSTGTVTDFDGDGKIDMYFAHRQCEHVWGDLDGDGTEECLKCGKIKDEMSETHMEG